jgi:hypothetical protein
VPHVRSSDVGQPPLPTIQLGDRDKPALRHQLSTELAVSDSGSTPPTFKTPRIRGNFSGYIWLSVGSLCLSRLNGGGGSGPSVPELGRSFSVRPSWEFLAARQTADLTPDMTRPSFGTLRDLKPASGPAASNQITEMAARDKRANRLESPLNGPVSGSVSADLSRQDPANSRAFLDPSSDPSGKSLHPEPRWRRAEAGIPQWFPPPTRQFPLNTNREFDSMDREIVRDPG